MRFEELRETLLKGGIAPRHVRRYLAELSEHLDDLTEKQRAQGYDREDAELRARALLGEDRELAAAMLEQKSLRSITARVPWAIFGILPPFAATAAMLVPLGVLVMTGKVLGFLEKGAARPHWFELLATATAACANLVFFPLASVLFVALVARHRLSITWALVAVAIPLLLFLHSVAEFTIPGHPGIHIGVGMAPIFLPKGWKTATADWPIVTAQYVLALLPLVWLARRRLSAR
jgi:hypothetical protein